MKASDQDREKAQLLVDHGKVARMSTEEPHLKDYYVVTGKNDDYLVILSSSRNFCSCDHFLFTCVKEPPRVCKHILAADMSKDEDLPVSPENWLDLLKRSH